MDWDTRVGCYAWIERQNGRGEAEVLLTHWRGWRMDDGRLIRGGWTLPGGGLELRETPEQAVIREVFEESGYAVRLDRMLGSTTRTVSARDRAHPGLEVPLQAVQLVWQADVVSGEMTAEVDGSSDDVGWFTRAELEKIPCADTVSLALTLLGREPLVQPVLSGMPVDEDAVARVLDAVELATPRRGSVLVVAVDGLSGSGKSVLGTALARDLACPLVRMDDLFAGWDGLAEAPARLTEQVLEPLARGEQAAYRRWDWHADDWAETVPVPASDTLVVEGCGSSVGPAAEHAAVRVWLEAERDVRMERGLARDGEAYRPHWQRWARQEDELFGADRTRERADIIIRSDPAGR